MIAVASNPPRPEREPAMRRFKLVVEKHRDGYVAYPIGLKGVVVGQGDTAEEAVEDAQSAIPFHIDTFGTDATDSEDAAIEVFLTDALVDL
jgi:predicted RNase H-like HicB family nuclease